VSRSTASDAAVRRRALAGEHCLIVQAPAGSGKTTLLVQRYLVLLARVERPEQVVVITFTRKATDELRERVLTALAQAAHGQAGPLFQEPAARVLARDAQQHWAITQLPARLAIYTIDALCAVLVRQMPWLSGLGGVARIEEKPERLYSQAATNVLAGLNARGDASVDLVRVFEHLDNDLKALGELLVRMLARREQWTPYLRTGSEAELELREPLQQGLALIIEDQLAALAAALPRGSCQALADLAAAVGHQHMLQDPGSQYVLLDGLQSLPPGNAEALPVWRALASMLLTADNKKLRKRDLKGAALAGLNADDKRAINARAHTLLTELAAADGCGDCLIAVAGLPDADFSESEWQLLQSLLEVLKSALAELRLIFAREGSVDFAEISAAALQALGPEAAPTDLALALDYRIQHLLVDEFQDTSRVHYELVERLSAGFTGQDGRSLFLVGDPMQSIYRFREAEVGLFLEAMQRGLPGLALEPLVVEANFRSRPALVEWFNATFAGVFPPRHDAPRSCVAYSEAVAQRAASEAPPVSLQGFLDDDGLSQGRRVAQTVARLRAERPEQSIAILVRGRAHLEAVLPALRAAGLRYRGVDIEPLAEVPVVRDLHALTRALLQPADRMSWLALLHAPWCGLRLGDLQALVGDDWDTTVAELLRDGARRGRLANPERERLERTLTAIESALEATRPLRLKRRVEACWIALGGPGLCTSIQLEDARRYFKLLDTLEADGNSVDLDHLDRRLEDLYASAGSAEADVEIITMHKAKGLEFDQVILPYLDRQPGSADSPLLQWTEVAFAGGTSLVFAARPAPGADDRRYRFVSALEADKQRNEAVRVLYVACTRAREQLHLLYNLKTNAKGEVQAPAASSLLAPLWPVLHENLLADLESPARERPDPAASSAPQAQTITRLAAGWRAPCLPELPDTGVAPELAPSAGGAELEFDWAGQTARHIGTVVHRVLREIALQGLKAWSIERIKAQRAHFARELETLGVPAERLTAAAHQVATALNATLDDPRGRWLLSAGQGAAELSLCGVLEGRLQRVILDRTFVDAHNVRWIVDYKTGGHAGADLEGFLDSEQQRYAQQLHRYAEILQRLDSRPIRLGLYFPLAGGWREWGFESNTVSGP